MVAARPAAHCCRGSMVLELMSMMQSLFRSVNNISSEQIKNSCPKAMDANVCSNKNQIISHYLHCIYM